MAVVFGYGGQVVFRAETNTGEIWTTDVGANPTDIAYHPDGPQDSLYTVGAALRKIDAADGSSATVNPADYNSIVAGAEYLYVTFPNQGYIAQLDYDGNEQWQASTTATRDIGLYDGTRREFVAVVGDEVVEKYGADTGDFIESISVQRSSDDFLRINQRGEVYALDDASGDSTTRIGPQFTIQEEAGAAAELDNGGYTAISESILIYNKGGAEVDYHAQDDVGGDSNATDTFSLSSSDYVFGGVGADLRDFEMTVGFEDTSDLETQYGVIWLDSDAAEIYRYSVGTASQLSQVPEALVSSVGENGANPALYYRNEIEEAGPTFTALSPKPVNGVSTGIVVLSTATALATTSQGASRANERTLTPIAVLPDTANPDPTVAFEGEVVLNGSAVEGARILAIETTTDTVVDTATTDANGRYATKQLTVDGSIYHLVAQYDDGSDRYNAPSKPYLG